MTKLAAIQMVSSDDVAENLATAAKLIEQSVALGAQLVVLPENFADLACSSAAKLALAEEPGHGPIQKFLAEQAKQHAVYLVAGTIPLRSEVGNKYYAASLVFDNQGQQQARYDKMHLFDVQVADEIGRYSESDYIQPGNNIVVVDSPVGKLGLAVCYDLRFPELFRQLVAKGAEIIAIPSAFTFVTGQAHWEVLLRARAIENLSYVIASAQGGKHSNGRETYGHSMIIDPWGIILEQKGIGAGVVVVEIDRASQQEIRQRFPVLRHKRI